MADYPLTFRVRQSFDGPSLPPAEIPAAVESELARLDLATRVKPGQSVAITAGSRGIANIALIIKATVAHFQKLGAKPFIVPAMGSHGGGTPQGQTEVLIGYQLGPADLGIDIRSSMEVVQIGATPAGMPVYFDAHAAAADAILVVNRIKPHTAFRNRWESGLMKMLAVGFGKERGAATIHSWGIAEAMPAAARIVLEKMPVVAGIGIVENGFHQPVAIAALPAEEIEAGEPELLQLAWQHLPRIPLEPLDMLVLQTIGKDISGTGMDLNIVGMWRRTGGPVSPNFRLITALDLTPNSHGNAVGVGYCDLIPQRLADKIDLAATYTNCLTAGNFNGAKLPITLPTDYAVLAAGLPNQQPQQTRLVIARNTLELDTLWVSEALLPEVERSPTLEQIGPLQPLPFTADGDLNLPIQHQRS